jgi:hypothetical protein
LKKLSLRPYHGEVWVTADLDELRRAYKRITRQAYPYTDDPKGGRYVLLENGTLGDRVFLVYSKRPEALAHEICHVLLIVFKTIGHDPREGDGEPFCYMLSQLMLEAA